MKITFVALVITILWPWAIGLVDIVAWGATGSQLTSIPWGGRLGAGLMLWPVVWVVGLMIAIAWSSND